MLLLVFFASFANSWAWYGQDQNGFMIMMMPMKAPVMNKAPVEESNVQEQPVHMPGKDFMPKAFPVFYFNWFMIWSYFYLCSRF